MSSFPFHERRTLTSSQFLTNTPEAKAFTEELIRLIRQQRHLSSRVLIATQEPTIAPALMDLCDVSIVHRFRSPAWFDAIKSHLAGMVWNGGVTSASGRETFSTIVSLQDGEALLFCPKAFLDLTHAAVDSGASTNLIDLPGEDGSEDSDDGDGGVVWDMNGLAGRLAAGDLPSMKPLGTGYIKLQIRTRLAKDVGKSQMAD
jgi:hypothetical protein